MDFQVKYRLENKKIIFFDGECPFCNYFVKVLLSIDKKEKFYFSTIDKLDTVKQIVKYNFPDGLPDSVIYFKNGKVNYKSGAVISILSDVGGGYKLFKFFYLIPGFLRDWFYDIIARNRHHLFFNKSCAHVPQSRIIT